MSDTLAEIVALVADYTGKEPGSIAPNAGFYELHLTGDDAREVMELFMNRFDVNMDSFVGQRFYDEEGWDFAGPAIVFAARLLSTRFDERWTSALAAEREITIGHLAQVAERGVWFDPPAGPTRPRIPALMLLLSLIGTAGIVFLAIVGAIGCWGYFTGQLGGVNLVTAFGLIAMSLLPALMVWSSVRGIRRKLASA